jgi:hypothetical protein
VTRKAKPPDPPAGLTAVCPNDWLQIWRRVRVQPKVEIRTWTGDGKKIKITPAIKAAGFAGCTFAEYDDGARIFPGNAILGLITGLDERTAGRAVGAICRLGFWWRYVDGSAQGRRRIASEYRLTVPDDFLARVPLLTTEFAISDASNVLDYPRISDPVISDPVISDTGTPDLRSRNTGSQIRPPLQDPPSTETHDGSLVGGSVEGAPAAVALVDNHDRDCFGGDLDPEAERRRQQDALMAWQLERAPAEAATPWPAARP